jgi:ABC-type ATPase involved in cell division
VSFVFQTFNLFPALTALENAEFGVDVAGRPEPTAVAIEMLERVGLGDRMRHFPHELSGGEQQRVAIAPALTSGNPTLLADEPTGELDLRPGVQILELLHAQAHTGRAVRDDRATSRSSTTSRAITTSVALVTYVLAVIAGMVLVAAAPLLTARKLRRTDIPSTLRVVEMGPATALTRGRAYRP